MPSALFETTLISLDGQVHEPMRFAGPYFDADALGDAVAVLDDHDAVLFGRSTFEAFQAAWADQTGEFADRLRATQKYVLSSSLTEARWENTSIIGGGDVASIVAGLKARHERGLVIYGHGRLSRSLLAARLTTHLRLNLHPVIAGGDTVPLQQDEAAALHLIGARSRGSGVVVLDYGIEG
jgi:dihydrofolate reductase